MTFIVDMVFTEIVFLNMIVVNTFFLPKVI
jgi:hypothetical protein